MKNSEEITNRLLERRELYLTEKKRKRKIITAIGTAACCIGIIAIAGIGLSEKNLFTPPVTGEHTLNDAIYPGIKDTFDDENGESTDNPQANNRIVINSTDEITSENMLFALMWDDFIPMTKEELTAYYGVDFIPEVPDDLKEQAVEFGGIYRIDKGTGEVYYDGNKLSYTNEDFSRGVAVSVDKGSYVYQQFVYFKGDEEKSVINNLEVILGLSVYGDYYAEFMYKGTGFFIYSEGLTEEEFISVIESVIK